MPKTAIPWTDRSWNLVTGCTPVHEGCDHCYAKRMAPRLRGRFGYPQDDPFAVTIHPDRLREPLELKKPQKIFVCSMGDLFHPRVPFEFIDHVFAVMALAKQHTFQILTKRPGRMAYYLTQDTPLEPRANFPHARPASRASRIGWAAQNWAENDGMRKDPDHPWLYQYPLPRRYRDTVGDLNIDEWMNWPLPNVWAGVSIPNARYLPWLDVLARVPAPVRFVSLEPLLGPVNISRYLTGKWWHCSICGRTYRENDICTNHGLVSSDGVKVGDGLLDWVIAGGESGPKARPSHPDWFRSARDQCQEAGVPFFFKQWGEWWGDIPSSDWRFPGKKEHDWDGETASFRIGRRAAGALLDGREWKEFPA